MISAFFAIAIVILVVVLILTVAYREDVYCIINDIRNRKEEKRLAVLYTLKYPSKKYRIEVRGIGLNRKYIVQREREGTDQQYWENLAVFKSQREAMKKIKKLKRDKILELTNGDPSLITYIDI